MEEQKEVRHPRECIKDFCLYHCQKKESKNSKRSVAECRTFSCPLYPYRLGKLRWEKPEKDLAKGEQNRRIRMLRAARREVDIREKALRQAEESSKKAEEIAKAKERMFQDSIAIVRSQRNKVDEAKTRVIELENAFYNKEYPDGLWR